MEEKIGEVMPVIAPPESAYRRELEISNLFEMQGVSGIHLYNPDDPPFEVSEHGEGKELTLNEAQTRSLHRQIGERIAHWDDLR